MCFKVVIPARYDSSRLPGKPLLSLLGKPVILHVIDRCRDAGIKLSDIFVATDDKRIFDFLEFEGIQVKLTSSSHVSGTDRINELVHSQGWDDDTIIINVQGDEPLIPPQLIKDLVNYTLVNPHFNITTAVVPISNIDDFFNPNVVKAVLGQNGRALNFTRSASPLNRDNPSDLSLARRHIGIYSYSVSSLKDFCRHAESDLENYEKLEQLRALNNGMSIGALTYNGVVNHGIDTQEDFEKLKIIMMEKL